MKREKLSQLLDISIGRTPSRGKTQYWGEGHRWVSIRDMSSKTITRTKEQITDLAVTEARCKLVKEGTLLFSFKLTIGKMAFAGCDLFTNEAIAAFEIKDARELNPDFLYYALQSASYGGSNQAVMGKTLNSKTLAEIEIPFPPLEDQIRIAHLLGKVEGLIAQRKQHLQELDGLKESVFLQIFGDPVRNEKGWDVQPCFKAVLDISSGTSYGGEDRVFEHDDEIGVLKISAVTKGFFDHSEYKVVNPLQISKALRFVKRGDFLISRANTLELVAACCVVPRDYPRLFLPDKLWVLDLNPELLKPQYFNCLLKNKRFRDLVRKLASGGHDSMLNISMKKFLTLNVPCPPLGMQTQFSAIVEKVERAKSHYQQSLTELETLYGALSQQAFKSELDLARVPLTAEGPNIAKDEGTNVEEEQPMEPSFDLSAPEEVALLQSAEGRKSLLNDWLKAWLGQLGDSPFIAQNFMDAVLHRLLEHADDDIYEWGVAEYEELKASLFEALEQGRLTQGYDDAKNRVQITAAKG
jgi:type I restriction enzyme S subunit